jgi:hypothetical protein
VAVASYGTLSPNTPAAADLRDRLGTVGPKVRTRLAIIAVQIAYNNFSESAMNEWMNLSTLGTIVVQQSVRFLYEQATSPTAATRRKHRRACRRSSTMCPGRSANTELIMATAALRLAMEQVLQQRLTFKGEQRSNEGLLGHPLPLIGGLLDDVLALRPLGLDQSPSSNSGLLNLKIGL